MAANPSFFQKNTSFKYSDTDLDLRLRQAAANGDLEEVIRLLRAASCKPDAAQRGLNPETGKQYTGRTALHMAVINKHLEVTIALIHSGWSCDLADSSGKKVTDYTVDPKFTNVFSTANIINHVAANLKEMFAGMKLNDKLPARPLRVISLACGIATEAIALRRYCPDRKIDFIGLDIDEQFVRNARVATAIIPDCKVYIADVTNMALLRTLGKFDLVFLRHPNIIYYPEVFKTIIQQSIPAVVHADSRVFLSTFVAMELEHIMPLTRELYCIPARENDDSVYNKLNIIPGSTKPSDSHSILFSLTPELKQQLQAEQQEEASSSMRLA